MSEHNETMANALELLTINQISIAAALEELARWVAQRGSTDAAESVTTALNTLDLNAEGIACAIRVLRQG